MGIRAVYSLSGGPCSLPGGLEWELITPAHLMVFGVAEFRCDRNQEKASCARVDAAAVQRRMALTMMATNAATPSPPTSTDVMITGSGARPVR